jgi:prepilin-type N-terminal cleavage/methylation domain-containing protein
MKSQITNHKSQTKTIRRNGFSLVEIIVSTGIIAIISITVAQAMFTSLRSNTKTELLKDIKQNGDFAMDVMTRLIQNARGITSPCTPAGATGPTLSIINTDGLLTSFGCSIDGAVFRIASVSGVQTDYLTSNNLTITGVNCAASSLTFTCTSVVDAPSRVQITFTLAQRGTPFEQYEQSSATFQTSVNERTFP